MMIKAKICLVLVVPVLAMLLSCTERKAQIYKKSTTIMDTIVTITVVSNSRERAEEAIDAAFGEIKDLEEKLSFWTDDSEIAAINRNAGIKGVGVSPETLDIIQTSLYISGRTGGAFDPTIGPVIRLWDFRKETIPLSLSLTKALEMVDYNALLIEGQEVFLSRKGMSFDTGGIAKGYAADRAAETLKQRGIKAGLIAIAGDIRAFGTKPDGSPWNIGIRNPRAEGDEDYLMATLELRDEAVSTSGDYERSFIKGGRRYHHLLSPKTGYPAEGFISVSVVADKAVHTDGFSTGVFVMGPEEGLRLMKEEGLEGVLVMSNGKIYVTDGLKNRIKWKTRPIVKKATGDK
jgi:thiamine biosynthesis lipoprotein